MLVPVALVVLARLEAVPRSLPLVLAATGLPAGPGAGALVALAGLVPSMPATGPPRPALALAGLAARVALAALAARVSEWRAGRLLVGVAVVAAPCGLALLGGAGGALRAVAGARASLASPDRTGALLAARQVVADHPLTGAGPGHTQLRWEGLDGVAHFFVYAHNEYAQVAAELGLVGLVLLALLLAGVARLLWHSRPVGAAAGPWAGVVAAAAAFAVHGGLDFIWHLPAVVLAVTVLAGASLPPPAPEIPIPVPPRKELHEATT